MNKLSILLIGMNQHVCVPTLTNDNATGLGAKLKSGFAPQGATPVTRRPTSRPSTITRPSLRPRPCFSHVNAGPTWPVGELTWYPFQMVYAGFIP